MLPEKQLDALLERVGRVDLGLLKEAEPRYKLGHGRAEDGEPLSRAGDVGVQEGGVEVGVLGEDVGGGAARHEAVVLEPLVLRAGGELVEQLGLVVNFTVPGVGGVWYLLGLGLVLVLARDVSVHGCLLVSC